MSIATQKKDRMHDFLPLTEKEFESLPYEDQQVIEHCCENMHQEFMNLGIDDLAQERVVVDKVLEDAHSGQGTWCHLKCVVDKGIAAANS